MTVSRRSVSILVSTQNELENCMLPDNFDPYLIVTGVRKRDWTKPLPTPSAPAHARTRGAAC